MISYDINLNKWVRRPGLSSSPWEVVSVPIGASFRLPVQFCCGQEIQILDSAEITLTIRKSSDAASVKIAEAQPDHDEGKGAMIFILGLSEAENQTDLQTPCYLQIQYEIDDVQYLTNLLEIVITNNYSA
jgi:hypothetical protein